MNGPSGLAADYLSWLVARHAEIRFVLQYAFWCALLWPQWQPYLALAQWCRQTRARRMVLCCLTLLLTLVGAVAASRAWFIGQRPSAFVIDRHFWFARVAGVAGSGLVLASCCSRSSL